MLVLSRRVVLLAVALALAGAAAAQAPDAVYLQPDPAAAALAVHDLVNKARARGGECGDRWVPSRPPLRWAADLAELAASWASDPRVLVWRDGLAVAFSHGDTRERSSPHRARAENIAGSIGLNPDPASAVRQWLEAPGHCVVLRSKVPDESGAAARPHALPDGKVLWVFVQVFR